MSIANTILSKVRTDAQYEQIILSKLDKMDDKTLLTMMDQQQLDDKQIAEAYTNVVLTKQVFKNFYYNYSTIFECFVRIGDQFKLLQ